MTFATFIFGTLALFYKDYKPRNDDSEDQPLLIGINTPESEEAIQ
jgi:hypothetical protein